MKERPILFSGEMVRAILDGRKTQTRRVVKPAKDRNGSGCHLAPCEIAGDVNGGDYSLCPYGQPGDRLWVRETLEVVSAWGVYYAASGPNSPEGYLDDRDERGKQLLDRYGDHHDTNLAKQIPSIHMPRWASRILLEIVSVRVERLQEISEVDAEAEGVLSCADSLDPYDAEYMPSELFSILWVSINGNESWHANPWVWVVKFKRLEAGGAA